MLVVLPPDDAMDISDDDNASSAGPTGDASRPVAIQLAPSPPVSSRSAVPPIAGASRDVPASGARRSRRTAAAARAGVSAPVYNEDERSAHIVAEIELNKRG